ncbi:MAG: WG repeat-containing protein [Phycisphaerae bacterium]|nr:WG repeat-containing protein [Phycisphaerae bacterium]
MLRTIILICVCALFSGFIYSVGSADDVKKASAEAKSQKPKYLYVIKETDKKGRDNYGYIDKTGKVVITPQFKQAGYFSEGLACVCPRNIFGSPWGYIDTSGKMVIKPQFWYAEEFSEGFAEVTTKTNKKLLSGFIDKKGKWLVKPQFEGAGQFKEGLAKIAVKKNGKKLIGFINTRGKIVIQPKFTYSSLVSYFSDGVTPVVIGEEFGNQWGAINKKGQWVVKPKFDFFLSNFKNGMAIANIDGMKGLIDTKGHWVIKPKYWFILWFCDGLAPVGLDKEDEWGFIDKKGKLVIKIHGDINPRCFSEGLASVSGTVINKKTNLVYKGVGYIDTKGKWIVKPRYWRAYDFKNGLARVWGYGGKTAYINKKGKYVWKEKGWREPRPYRMRKKKKKTPGIPKK